MTGADKVVCQAATLLLLFTLTAMPAKAQFAGLGGGGGGGDMMTQMAPMLEMMKAKMGKRRFAMMMQTMGPMMSRMMEGGGGLGGMMGGGGIPGGFGGGIPAAAYGGSYGPTVTARTGRHRRRRLHGHDRRRRRRRADEHDPATDADGQCRRRPSPASPAAVRIRHSGMVRSIAPDARGDRRFLRCAIAHWSRCFASPRNDGVYSRQRRPHRRHGASLRPPSGQDHAEARQHAEQHHGGRRQREEILRGGAMRRQPPAAGGDEQQPRGLRQHRADHLGRALR